MRANGEMADHRVAVSVVPNETRMNRNMPKIDGFCVRLESSVGQRYPFGLSI